MTWNSSCSLASDDDSSRHSFLSDCDSELDLRPPPRYPAEKRAISRLEPPLTRSRAKATGKTLPSSPSLPKTRRTPAVRRRLELFPGFTASLKTSLPQNSFLLSNDRVNFLTDRLENCSLDEEKVNRNCVWPSRETNSHYTRPIPTFGGSPFPSLPVFGQQQTQLWSRFRLAASELRNDVWLEQVNFAPLSSNPPIFSPSPSLRHRQINAPSPIPVSPSPVQKEVRPARVSLSKILFILTIFTLGLLLGYVLTSTFPPSRLSENFAHYNQVIHSFLFN